MSATVLYMSMSLDGYIADPNDRLGGNDGNRLHHWFATALSVNPIEGEPPRGE